MARIAKILLFTVLNHIPKPARHRIGSFTEFEKNSLTKYYYYVLMVELVNLNSIYIHGITLVAYLPNIIPTKNVCIFFFKFSFGLLGEKNLLFKFDHRLFYTPRRFRGNKEKPYNTAVIVK